MRRPSKSTIVQKSLEFILTTRQKEKRHEREVRQLLEENSSFREEINRLRAQLGLELLPPREETQPKDCSDTSDNNSNTTNTQTSTMKEDIDGNNSTTKSPILEKKNHEADDNTQSTVNTLQQSTLPELDSNTVMDIQTSMYTPRSDATSRSDDDCGGNSESELDDKQFGSVDDGIDSSECLYDGMCGVMESVCEGEGRGGETESVREWKRVSGEPVGVAQEYAFSDKLISLHCLF